MAYVVQAALGGHAIPIDAGTMAVLRVLDLVTEKDAAAGVVPGLERAIAKSKGVEFGSLLHELGADYSANPYSSQVREILLAIDPESAERFPQRRQPRPEPAAADTPPAPEAIPAAPTAGRKKKGEKAAAVKPADGEGKAVEAKASESKPNDGKSAEAKKPPASPAKKSAESPHEPSAGERPEKIEKPERIEKPSKTEKPTRVEKAEKRPAEPTKSAPAAETLGKRKPR